MPFATRFHQGMVLPSLAHQNLVCLPSRYCARSLISALAIRGKNSKWSDVAMGMHQVKLFRFWISSNLLFKSYSPCESMSIPHCYPPSNAIHDDSYRFVLFPLGEPPFHLNPPCHL